MNTRVAICTRMAFRAPYLPAVTQYGHPSLCDVDKDIASELARIKPTVDWLEASDKLFGMQTDNHQQTGDEMLARKLLLIDQGRADPADYPTDWPFDTPTVTRVAQQLVALTGLPFAAFDAIYDGAPQTMEKLCQGAIPIFGGYAGELFKLLNLVRFVEIQKPGTSGAWLTGKPAGKRLTRWQIFSRVRLPINAAFWKEVEQTTAMLEQEGFVPLPDMLVVGIGQHLDDVNECPMMAGSAFWPVVRTV